MDELFVFEMVQLIAAVVIGLTILGIVGLQALGRGFIIVLLICIGVFTTAVLEYCKVHYTNNHEQINEINNE